MPTHVKMTTLSEGRCLTVSLEIYFNNALHFLQLKFFFTVYLYLHHFQIITLMQRRHPPPDLDMIEDGWVLTEKEAAEKMIKKRLINRMSKKIVVLPQLQGEKEYMQRCKKIALEMLLGVRNL